LDFELNLAWLIAFLGTVLVFFVFPPDDWLIACCQLQLQMQVYMWKQEQQSIQIYAFIEMFRLSLMQLSMEAMYPLPLKHINLTKLRYPFFVFCSFLLYYNRCTFWDMCVFDKLLLWIRYFRKMNQQNLKVLVHFKSYQWWCHRLIYFIQHWGRPRECHPQKVIHLAILFLCHNWDTVDKWLFIIFSLFIHRHKKRVALPLLFLCLWMKRWFTWQFFSCVIIETLWINGYL
jgi:hypothetical protein